MSTPEAKQEQINIVVHALVAIIKAVRDNDADALEIVREEALEALSAVRRLDVGAGR